MVPGPCPCPGPWPVVLAPQSSVRYSVFRSGELGVGNRESGIGSSRSVRGQTHFVDARVWTQVSESVHCLLRGVVTLWVVDGGGWRWLEVVGGWWVAIERCEHLECYKMPTEGLLLWFLAMNTKCRTSPFSFSSAYISFHALVHHQFAPLRFAMLSFDKWLRWCFLLPRPIWLNCVSPWLLTLLYSRHIYIYICICIHIYAWMWHISFITIDTDFGLPVTPFLV